MRRVVDTNIIIGALLAEASLSAHLIVLWRVGRFDRLTSAEQLDELMRVTRYPKIRGGSPRRWPDGRSTNCMTCGRSNEPSGS